MIQSIECPALSVALEKLRNVVAENESGGKKTLIFCEDRLTLAAERTVCSAAGGTFLSSVYTFARFLSSEGGRRDLLSSQGSAMAIRSIIEERKQELKLFGRFAPSAAAGAVYDTIALLYSSGITADDVKNAAADGLLESKLHDIGIIYAAYNEYLATSGKTDRNAYLAELPRVIESSGRVRESAVVFLGFQSFTRSALECVRAAMRASENVYGLFIGGGEEIYVNEASAAFIASAEMFGGADICRAEGGLIPEADALRRGLFDAESYCSDKKLPCGNVHVFEASDEEEELEFIAASIKKHISNGERYAKISVMLPDVKGAECDLKRIFAQYRIPYYADRRYALSEHPIAEFIINYLSCAAYGCRFKDCDTVISSPMFDAARADKDAYRNYALRLANFRGGVRREPDCDVLSNMKFCYEAVQNVRGKFLKGLELLPVKGGGAAYCGGLRRLFEYFDCEDKLACLSQKFKDSYPAMSEFSGRVYESVLSVLGEAESIAGADVPLPEFIKILKSGFKALEISLIPPKADAVFVGDIAATANTGSNIVFAARLTGDVPSSGADTALLTDREIAELEKININISPKIRQVNMRSRETTALNICAFKKELYLSYPMRVGGEECCASEIISYASALLASPSAAPLKAVTVKRLEKSERALPYYCSEKLPAIKKLSSPYRPEAVAAVYSVLEKHGFKEEADKAVSIRTEKKISDGRKLYASYNSVTPTALETYFLCPYRSFMQQGLKLKEREEGAMRPVDTGNFIHAVLQELAKEINTIADENGVRERSRSIAENMLEKAPYSSLTSSKSGQYTASELIKEAQTVSAGMYEQIVNSRFKVESAEQNCQVRLSDGIKVFGRIDRVDSYEDMVRVVDYKTGNVEFSAVKYYMGLKLQLPLYLLSVSEGRRAAGAYYFPASVDYRDKNDGVFRLQGFMDGSEEVVSVSDTTLEEKKKSAYFDAYLKGRKMDSAMGTDELADFISYSACVAAQGAEEMLGGNITPSPVEDACSYCKMGGSCGFTVGVDGAERVRGGVKCADIAGVMAKRRGD